MKKTVLLLFVTFPYTLLLAQEDAQNTELNIETENSSWFASPWVWIIGAAAFILLLVALTRGKKEGE